jgi:hypothetical protein
MEIFGNKKPKKNTKYLKKHKIPKKNIKTQIVYGIFAKINCIIFHNYFYHNIINNKMTHNIIIKIFIYVYKYTA